VARGEFDRRRRLASSGCFLGFPSRCALHSQPVALMLKRIPQYIDPLAPLALDPSGDKCRREAVWWP